MDLVTIMAAIQTAAQIAKQLYDLGKDVKPILDKIIDITSKGGDVTQQDLDELRATSDSWAAQIQQPVPPEEE
jgi:hypothetical protein